MAETENLILDSPPKKLEYLVKLLNYDKPETTFDRLKNYITKDKTRPHSISEWSKILGSTKNNGNTREFLNMLAENGALEKTDEKGSPPNKVSVYTVNKDRLVEVFYESEYWNWHRDLVFSTVNKAEPSHKIVRDF